MEFRFFLALEQTYNWYKCSTFGFQKLHCAFPGKQTAYCTFSKRSTAACRSATWSSCLLWRVAMTFSVLLRSYNSHEIQGGTEREDRSLACTSERILLCFTEGPLWGGTGHFLCFKFSGKLLHAQEAERNIGWWSLVCFCFEMCINISHPWCIFIYEELPWQYNSSIWTYLFLSYLAVLSMPLTSSLTLSSTRASCWCMSSSSSASWLLFISSVLSQGRAICFFNIPLEAGVNTWL